MVGYFLDSYSRCTNKSNLPVCEARFPAQFFFVYQNYAFSNRGSGDENGSDTPYNTNTAAERDFNAYRIDNQIDLANDYVENL